MKKIFLGSILSLLLFFPGKENSYTGWSYLQNSQVKIGINLDRGAIVSYFSQISPERNLINYHDAGRGVQQSYYGNDYLDAYYNGVHWYWNPVQGGDSTNHPSTVVTITNDGTTLYAKTIPKDWALSNVDVNGYMEEWITLQGDIAKIHFKFTYTGGVTQVYNEPPEQGSSYQEVPAAFFDYALNNVVYYAGVSPWTNDTVTTTAITDHGYDSWEEWIAIVDDTNWGIGYYTPGCSHFHAGPRFRFPGGSGPNSSDTTYTAANKRIARMPQNFTYEYDVYLKIGTTSEIRTAFYQIHGGAPPTGTNRQVTTD